MGLAPTEKHLEDWIVNNIGVFKTQTNLPIQRIVGRQIPMPSGILDILVTLPLSVTVIELKKGQIDEKAVAQLHRYIVDLVDLHDSIYRNIKNENDLHAHSSSVKTSDMWRYPIHGMLVGNSITNRALMHCENSHIETVMYDLDQNGIYTFERDMYSVDDRSQDDYTSETVGAIKELMRHLKLRERGELTRDMFVWEDRS